MDHNNYTTTDASSFDDRLGYQNEDTQMLVWKGSARGAQPIYRAWVVDQGQAISYGEVHEDMLPSTDVSITGIGWSDSSCLRDFTRYAWVYSGASLEWSKWSHGGTYPLMARGI